MDRRWKVLAIAALSAFLAFLDATIVNIAFPDIRRSFPAISLSTLSWILSAYNIVFAALLVPAGRLADLLGRRRLFVGGLATFSIASLLCALAPSPGLLVAARVLQAGGGAALVPASVAFLLDEFPVQQRAMAMGLWTAAAAVAAAVGPSLGALLIDLGGWRLVFLVNVPVGLLMSVYAHGVLREFRESQGASLPDLVGVVLIAVAVASLVLAIVQGPEWGWTSARVLGGLLVAVVLATLFVHRCATHPAPVIDLGLFGGRALSMGNAGTLLFSAGFYGMLLCHVLFLTTIWRYSVLQAGLAMSLAPLAAGAIAVATGRAADLWGPRPLALPGVIAFAAGNLWFAARVGSSPHFLSQWLPGALLTGAGVGLVYPALGGASVAELTAARFSSGSSLNAMFRQIGGALGISVIVAILQSGASEAGRQVFLDGWSFAAAMALLALGPVLALGPRVPLARSQSTDSFGVV